MRAGLIVSGSTGQVTEIGDIQSRAAARAAKQTGCCVAIQGIHTAVKQTQILLEEGLDPSRVIIGHCDDATAIDLERDKEFCRKGFYVAFDRIGIEPTWCAAAYALSDFVRVDLIKAMIDAGFINQIVISADSASPIPTWQRFIDYARTPSIALLHFHAKMYRVGIRDGQIDTILVQNPKRVLPF